MSAPCQPLEPDDLRHGAYGEYVRCVSCGWTSDTSEPVEMVAVPDEPHYTSETGASSPMPKPRGLRTRRLSLAELQQRHNAAPPKNRFGARPTPPTTRQSETLPSHLRPSE